MQILRLIGPVVLPILFISCRPDENSKLNGLINWQDVQYLSDSLPSPKRNPLSPAGVVLGRKLFYDPILSKSGEISCASCHRQSNTFADSVALTTIGETGNALLRNTPALINLAWQQRYFWDGGVRDLESQAFGALQHPDEMATDLGLVTEKLNNDPMYQEMFREAFHIDSISSKYITRALAQFERTLISASSKYDRWKRGDSTLLSDKEMAGLVVFEQNCGSCHPPPFFMDHSFHNNGLDSLFDKENLGINQGRYRISFDENDVGKFKTPTLRNVALSAPYMHDGRYESLEEVLDHYANGMVESATLNPFFRKKSDGLGIELKESEKSDLLAFLQTLTDSTFVSNPDYAEPNF